MSKVINTILEEICLKGKRMIISGPFGSDISSKYFVESGIPVIRGNNLSINCVKFIDDGFVFVTKEKADSLGCYAIADDLIFTAAGTIGQVGIMPKKGKYSEYIISNKQIRARVDKDIIDPQYAYYWFSGPWIRKLLENNNKGSTVPLLTLSEVKQLPISFPQSKEEQRKIVKVIDDISSKITNNNKIITELELMAKTLYDYWFLQFEFPNEEGKPYKSSGGKMVYNKELKREIPEGWEVKTIGDLVMRNNKKFDYKSVQKNIDLSVMPSDSIAVNQFNSSKDFSTNLFVMNKGDILFGSIRPYLHKACIAPCMGTFAGTVYSYAVKEGKDYNLVLTTLTRKAFFDYAESCCHGTKMPVVRNESILEYKLAYNSKFTKLFNDYVNIKDSVPNLIMQNQELASLRDFLLPMLMNGQVTFK